MQEHHTKTPMSDPCVRKLRPHALRVVHAPDLRLAATSVHGAHTAEPEMGLNPNSTSEHPQIWSGC